MVICRRQAIPLELTEVQHFAFFLTYLEACNNSANPITLSVEDAEGLPVIPSKAVNPGEVLTYQSTGAPTTALWWKASAVGLFGWFKGDRL